MTGLTKQQADSIKESYSNIVAMFLAEEKVPSKYLTCLLIWAAELGLDPADIRRASADISIQKLSSHSEKVHKVEAIYHLVQMICMDQVVEDVELEIASIYAEKLGFRGSFVSDLLKSIVTADTDETPTGDVRQQVIDFMKLHGE